MLVDVATRSSAIRNRRTSELAGFLVLSGSALAFLLLLVTADHYSLWIDEAITGLVMRESSSMGGLLAFLQSSDGSEPAQALYYVLVWLWSRIAGDGEAALRLPSVAFSLGASIALWFALRQLGIPRRVANPAAASFIALPVVMWYALEARPYALIVLAAATHLAWTLFFLRRPTTLRLGVLALLTIAVALTYSIAGVAAILSLLSALGLTRFTGRDRSRTAQGISAVIALSTGGAVGAITLASLARASAGRQPEGIASVVASFGYAAYELVLGRSVGFSVIDFRVAGGINGLSGLVRAEPVALAIAIICTSGLVAVAVAGLRGLRPKRDVDLLIATVPWLIVGSLFCAYAVYPGFLLLGRHLVFLLPAAALLTIVGLSRISKRGQIVSVAVVWIVGSIAFAGFLFDPRYAKDDFRAAARIVSECQLRSDQIVLLSSEPGFSYYGVQGLYGLRGRPNHFSADDPGSGDIQAGLDFLRAKGADPAVIIVDTSRYDRNGYVDAELRRNTGLHRLDLASLTMVSTVPLDGCALR